MIKRFTFNHYEVNCYVVSDDRVPTAGEKRRCAIVDPACEASFEDAQLTQYIEAEGLRVTHILLTHAHVDHIAGLRQCCMHYGLPVTMHAEGRKLLRQAEAYGSLMGFAVDDMSDLEVVEIEDGEVLHAGDATIECRYVPGHCPGSMCFVVPREKAVLTGDALFHFSIGRTDLPGGNYHTLIAKIKERLLTLPDKYIVLPGHGEQTTIGDEKQYNPFL